MVIDSSGGATGKVKDVMFSLDGGVILVVEKKDGAEVQVPLSKVVGLSEFVVTRSEALPEHVSLGTPSASAGSRECKFCGYEMGSSTVYCPGCGRSQM
jgi:hypothetical protein